MFMSKEPKISSQGLKSLYTPAPDKIFKPEPKPVEPPPEWDEDTDEDSDEEVAMQICVSMEFTTEELRATFELDADTQIRIEDSLERSFDALGADGNRLGLTWGQIVSSFSSKYYSFLKDTMPMGIEKLEEGYPKVFLLTKSGVLWIEVAPVNTKNPTCPFRQSVQLNLPEGL